MKLELGSKPATAVLLFRGSVSSCLQAQQVSFIPAKRRNISSAGLDLSRKGRLSKEPIVLPCFFFSVPCGPIDDPCCFCAGLGEADANQNNGCVSEKPAVTDSTGAEGPREPWTPASTADPDAATPRPHLVRLFSRDAPGREDNTFKERPSESDELQTIQEHSGAASECGSESPEQDLE